MSSFPRGIPWQALGLLLTAGFLAGCSRSTLRADPCASIGTKDYADQFFEDVEELRVQKAIPENNDNYFWLYEVAGEQDFQELPGGGRPYLSLDSQGARSVTFRARVVDDGNTPQQIPSDLSLTFVIGYEFPENDCLVSLDWTAHPYLYLPHGLEVTDPENNDVVPSGSPVSHIQFQVYAVEDPEGDVRIDAIPSSLTESQLQEDEWQLLDSVRYIENFSASTSVFRNTYRGSFVVSPGVRSRLFIVLAVWLHASWPGERVCIGCNLPVNQPNDLLESAEFSVGSGSGGSNGPFWIMESIP